MTRQARTYVQAWVALLGLTALSFGIDHLQLGGLATAFALAIAMLKASVVLLAFMHLAREPFPVRFVAFLNFAWIALLCLGIAADVAVGG